MHINKHGQYVYKNQPKRCKACGSDAIDEWVFGFPGRMLMEDQLKPEEQRKYRLGGCSVDQMYVNDLIKSWHCKQCGMDFYSELDPMEKGI